MKLKWILVALAALAIGIALYLYFRKSDDFEPLIKEKLTKLVTKASDGLYVLQIESIEIDVLESSITASNVSLMPDSIRMTVLDKNFSLPDDIYSGTLKNLHITGISANDLINAKDISLGEIVMNAPEITITHKKRNYNRPDTGNFYSRIAPKNESYALKNLTLKKIQLTYKNLDKNNQSSQLKNLTAIFSDIKIDSSTVHDSTRFLFAKEASMFLKNYTTVTANKLYFFTIDSIMLRPQQGSLMANNIRLKPIGTKDEFRNKVDYLQDRYDVFFDEGSFKNISWFSLIANEAILADSLYLNRGYINVYSDKRLPKSGKSKVGNYPHQMLKKIDLPVKMNYLSINNATVTYEEFNPVSNKTGKVVFNNTDGEIWNITNMPEQIATAGQMKVRAKTKFMNEASLDVVFNFDLRNVDNGIFSVDATMGVMDGKKINKASEGLGLVMVEEMQIDQLKTHINGSNSKANGSVLFAYHDLKIVALKEDEEGGDLKKKSLVTLIANAFVINKSNPTEGKPVKQYPVAQQRDPERSFFNLIWQCIKEGVKKTVKK